LSGASGLDGATGSGGIVAAGGFGESAVCATAGMAIEATKSARTPRAAKLFIVL
jgi:hypothetical protein